MTSSSPRISFLSPFRPKTNRSSSYTPATPPITPPSILLTSRRVSAPDLPRPAFARDVTRSAPGSPNGSPRSRAIRFQGEQARQEEQEVDHTTKQDRELDAVVISHSSGPLPSLPVQEFDPFRAGLGIEGFDKMFDGFTRFDTRAMAGSALSTPSPAPSPPPIRPAEIPPPTLPKEAPSYDYRPGEYHLDRALPLPPQPTRAFTAPALSPINTQLEEDDFIPVLDVESSTDHTALERKPTLHVPHGSLVFPVPRPFMRPRALSTSAIGSPNETAESVTTPASGYTQYSSNELPPLLPQHMSQPHPRAQSVQPERQVSQYVEIQEGDPSNPTPPESILSVRSQVPFTGYTEEHILPLVPSSSGYDPSQLSIPSYAPPKLSIQAATPQTPTRLGLLPIPKKASLTNIAAMFNFNPSSSPLGRTSPKKRFQSQPETYATATVRLKREKMALDLAMKRKAQRDGLISPQKVSPDEVPDWEMELRALEAAEKERTIKEERRRSQDWKEKERKRKSDVLRIVYGWQEDVQ